MMLGGEEVAIPLSCGVSSLVGVGSERCLTMTLYDRVADPFSPFAYKAA